MELAERLHKALVAAGVQVDGVAFKSRSDKKTWRVAPETLQPAAQPIIDAFDVADPTVVASDQDAETDAFLNSIDDAVMVALLENFTAMHQAAVDGTFQMSLWRQRLRSRIKILRRKK